MQKSKLQLKNKKWDYVPILQYCDFERGTEPGSNAYNREGDGVPFIRVGNIAAQIQKQIYTISENINLCKKDDVLLVLDGSPGVVVKGVEGAFSSGIRRVIVKEPKKNLKDFVFYALQADFVQNTIKEYSTGVTIKHASKSLEHIKIPLLPFPIQQKIVKVLDTVREAVDVQEKIIEKTKELKKSSMHKLFKEGTRGAKLKKTEIGEIPENWEVIQIQDVVLKTEQNDPSKNSMQEIKYIDVSSISNDFLKIIDYKSYFGKDAPSRARKILKENDIIFATVRPYLKRIAFVAPKYDGFYASTAFCVLRSDIKKVVPYYLFYYVSTDSFVFKVSGYQTGSGYPAITDNNIKRELISFPSLTEQREIAEILQTIDRKIEIEQKKKELYKELFKTMLNKLMTGEIKADKLML